MTRHFWDEFNTVQQPFSQWS